MSSEGAKSQSNSMKKGFCAPLIKNDASGRKLSIQTSEKKLGVKVDREKTATQITGKKMEMEKLSADEKSASSGGKTTNQNPTKKIEIKAKPQISLTDSQYEEIFQAVLQDTAGHPNNTSVKNNLNNSFDNRGNTPSCDDKDNTSSNDKKNTSSNDEENTPCNDQENTPSYDVKVGMKRSLPEGDLLFTTPPSKRSKTHTESSPWGSIFNKQLSQASSVIEDVVNSESSLINSCPTSTKAEGVEEREGEDDTEGQLSQGSHSDSGSQPKAKSGTNKAPEDKRSRLENLQRLRNVGLWVFCCRPSCQKQRYLADVTDPQDVPEMWYCYMNPDEKHNSCEKPEQTLSAEEEADMIYNEYTAGSVVWARVPGYPWWPAMVDDDPDLEQFYWLKNDNVTVTHYHVVFFDEAEVTRAWVSLKDISSFAKNEHKYKKKASRGINYSRRLQFSRDQAKAALRMNNSQRLSVFSFISRYDGPINTPVKNMKKNASLSRKKVMQQTDQKNAEIGLKMKNEKRNLKKKEQTGGAKQHLEQMKGKKSTMKVSMQKKTNEPADSQLSDKSVVKKNKLKDAMFQKQSMHKLKKSANKSSKVSQKNSNTIDVNSNLQGENKKVIYEQIVSNGPFEKIVEQNPSSAELNTNMDVENELKIDFQFNLPRQKDLQVEGSVKKFNGEKELQVEDSVLIFNGEKELPAGSPVKMLDRKKEPHLEGSCMMFDKENEPQAGGAVKMLDGEKEPQFEDLESMFDGQESPLEDLILMLSDDNQNDSQAESPVKMLNREKKPQLEDSFLMFDDEKEPKVDDSKTPYENENSQKSNLSERALKPMVKETLGKMIELSENMLVASPGSQVLSPEYLSQSTVAHYLANEPEDAVVPGEADYDLTPPFEE